MCHPLRQGASPYCLPLEQFTKQEEVSFHRANNLSTNLQSSYVAAEINRETGLNAENAFACYTTGNGHRLEAMPDRVSIRLNAR
jgi:hypothetical protein